MTVDQLIQRAVAACSMPITYSWGSGGMDPDSPTPAGPDGAADCSGYLAWCLKIKRQTDHPLYIEANGGWINTDAMVRDIHSSVGYFTACAPERGALIVYPGPPMRTAGHCGLIVQVENDQPFQVVHCASAHDRRHPDRAVQLTDATVFLQPDTVYGRWVGLTAEEPEEDAGSLTCLDVPPRPLPPPLRTWWRWWWLLRPWRALRKKV
jgi:hypothetical protein